MDLAAVIVMGVVGLFAGSAIWVFSRAQVGGRPLFSGPVCEACQHPQSALAWLPLSGFGVARRCAACGVSQGWVRPGFEIAVALYMALLALEYGWSGDLLAAALFTLPILVILLVDWWIRLIYTNVIGLGLILGLGAAALDGWSELVNAAFSAVGAAAVFGLLFVMAALIYRNVRVVPFGLGDVYLAAMIGSMVRFPAVMTALFLGVFLAGVILMLLLATKRVSRRTAVPYGPFLCAGALISIAVG